MPARVVVVDFALREHCDVLVHCEAVHAVLGHIAPGKVGLTISHSQRTSCSCNALHQTAAMPAVYISPMCGGTEAPDAASAADVTQR